MYESPNFCVICTNDQFQNKMSELSICPTKKGKECRNFSFSRPSHIFDHRLSFVIGYIFHFQNCLYVWQKKGKMYIFFHFPTISNVRPSVIFCHCILISIPDLSINSDIKTEKKMFKCFHFPTIINVQIHQIMPRGGHSLKSMVMLKNKHPPPLIFQEFTPPAKVTPFHDIYVKKPCG